MTVLPLITDLFSFPVANVVSAFRMSNTSGQAIVVILLIGSVFAWSIMVTKFSEIKAATQNSHRFASAYRNSRHPLILFVKGRADFGDSPLYALYRGICGHLAHTVRLSESEMIDLVDSGKTAPLLKEYQLNTIRSFTDQLLSERMLDMEKHMGILATAATAAPFLGLLGTVWGVMDAFGGLALSASATLSAVAPGVSGALLTTVVGLIVALPSLIGYNVLVGRMRRLTILSERFAQEVMGDIERRFRRE